MRQRRCHAHALSLPELLVSLLLFGLISGAVALLVRTGLEYLRQTEARAELQRNSLFVLNQLTRELAESSLDGLRLADPVDDPPGLVFASPRGEDGVVYKNNRLAWRRLVAVYWDQNERLLVRAAEPLAADSTFIPDLSPQGLNRSVASFQTSPSSTRRVLGRNVSSFSTALAGGQVELRLEVSVNEGSYVSKLSTRTSASPAH